MTAHKINYTAAAAAAGLVGAFRRKPAPDSITPLCTHKSITTTAYIFHFFVLLTFSFVSTVIGGGRRQPFTPIPPLLSTSKSATWIVFVFH